MHHKRRRPKSRRAGCLMCKGWKHQRINRDSAKANWRGSARPQMTVRESIMLGIEQAGRNEGALL